MKRYDEKGQSTWLKVQELTYRPKWSHLRDDALECYQWLRSDGYTRDHYKTSGNTGTCLVGIGCYDHGTGDRYTTVAATVPRGDVRDYLYNDGRGPSDAQEWWKEAITPPSDDRTLVFETHVEDFIEVWLERMFRSLVPHVQGAEPVRLVVVGTYNGQTTPQVRDLCNKRGQSRKNPSCSVIARRRGFRFPTEDMPIGLMDQQDLGRIREDIYYRYLQERNRAPAQSSAQELQGGQRPTTSGSGSSKISSGSYLDDLEYDPKTGKLVAADNSTSRTSSQERGVRSARHAAGGGSSYGVSDLARGMEALRMGGGGGRSSRTPLEPVGRREGTGYASSTAQYDSRSDRRDREYSSRSDGRGYSSTAQYDRDSRSERRGYTSSATVQYSSRSDDRAYSSRSDGRGYPSSTSQSSGGVVYSSRSERSRDTRDTAGRRVVRYE